MMAAAPVECARRLHSDPKFGGQSHKAKVFLTWLGMRASTRWDVAAMLLAVAVCAGCGDDAADDDDLRPRNAAVTDAADSGGAGASGVGGARRSGSSGTGGRSAADSGSAGGAAVGGRPATPMTSRTLMRDVQGCPSLEFAGLFVLPTCCTSGGMCGIDVSVVGGVGCLDLATAAERAWMAGASAPFPAPRACGDLDAGMHDAGM